MKKTIFLTVFAIFLAVMMSGVAFSSENKTSGQSMSQQQSMGQNAIINGTIDNHNRLIKSNGETYQIAPTKEGQQLSYLVGSRVQVTGTVMEKGGKKQIKVSSYQVIKR